MAPQVRNPNDEGFETAMAVVEAEFASLDQLRRANAWRHKHRPQIGKLAMTLGKLTMAQVFDILGQQAVSGELFGKTAVQMGYLDESDLYELLQKQTDFTPTLADSLVALNVITPEQGTFILKQSSRRAPEPSAPMLAGAAAN